MCKIKFIAVIIVLVITSNAQYLMAKNNKVYIKHNYKIGVVDIAFVLKSYAKKLKIKSQLQKEKEKLIKEIKIETKRIKKLEYLFESKKGTLSQIDFRRNLAEIEIRKEKLSEIVKKRNDELIKLESILKAPILRNILEMIEKVRQEKGFDVILNKNDVLSYSIRIDLTYEIIDRLKNIKPNKNR